MSCGTGSPIVSCSSLADCPENARYGAVDFTHGQLHAWRAKNGSASVHPISGPRAVCAAALEERAGARLAVRVHERAVGLAAETIILFERCRVLHPPGHAGRHVGDRVDRGRAVLRPPRMQLSVGEVDGPIARARRGH
jgi:hypothetical protein